jgi:hypothetical protein
MFVDKRFLKWNKWENGLYRWNCPFRIFFIQAETEKRKKKKKKEKKTCEIAQKDSKIKISLSSLVVFHHLCMT